MSPVNKYLWNLLGAWSRKSWGMSYDVAFGGRTGRHVTFRDPLAGQVEEGIWGKR